VGDQIKIRITISAEVTDAAALTAAAMAALDAATASDDDELDLTAMAELRAAIPDDPSAAVVALVDPAYPLEELPGVAFTGIDVETGTDLDEPDGPDIQLP
jgi:hypothetical protein